MATLDLGDRYEDLIERLVESGRFSTPSEVVRHSLRLLEERERASDRSSKLQDLRVAIAEGDESGEPEPLDMAGIKRDAKQSKHRRTA